MDIYIKCTFKTISFCGASNINLNVITCEGEIVITSILQSYVLCWHYTHLLHPGMDRTEVVICQHFYWPRILNSVHKKVTKCDNSRRMA